MTEGELDITPRPGNTGSDGAPRIQPTTGLKVGLVEMPLRPEGILERTRRRLMGLFNTKPDSEYPIPPKKFGGMTGY